MSEERSKRLVLVADDEPAIADTLVLILNQSGFQASAVYSGEMAVEAAEELKPDVLISDVVMGAMSGIDAAIRIHKKVPGCHVILFSGQAGTTDWLEKAKTRGQVFEMLTKPVHPQVLLDRLHDSARPPGAKRKPG